MRAVFFFAAEICGCGLPFLPGLPPAFLMERTADRSLCASPPFGSFSRAVLLPFFVLQLFMGGIDKKRY